MDRRNKIQTSSLVDHMPGSANGDMLGYRYLDRKIPDELYVTESQEQQVKNVLDYPLLSFDDAITVSGDGSYLLSSRILGVIPFKDVKVIPTDSTTVLVSGSTVGIYNGNRRSTGN